MSSAFSPSRASNRFDATLAAHGVAPLSRRTPTTLQVNMGKLCNQACRHCHVDASPTRTELMDAATVERVLAVLEASPCIEHVDITGGAPEMNPRFRMLVDGVHARGRRITVRCNLTVLFEEGQDDLAEYYAAHDATIIASLPCYTAANTDTQRGSGAFGRSIAALLALNAVGYGDHQGAKAPSDGPAPRRLNLVYNPLGPSLPPPQASLEADYRERLRTDFNVVFDELLTITNMPIHRFADDLERQGKLGEYEQLLVDSFSPQTVQQVMCRDLVSVDWDGKLADCDFHQMLDIPLGAGAKSIFDVDDFATFAGSSITTAAHCLGCTAGQGSSCGGALDG